MRALLFLWAWLAAAVAMAATLVLITIMVVLKDERRPWLGSSYSPHRERAVRVRLE